MEWGRVVASRFPGVDELVRALRIVGGFFSGRGAGGYRGVKVRLGDGRVTYTELWFNPLQVRLAYRLFGGRYTGGEVAGYGSCGGGKPGASRLYATPGEVYSLLRSVLAFDTSGRSGYEALVVGARGSGKSSLQEASALVALAGGATVLDLFGAPGGEQLGWLYYATGMAPETRLYLHCMVLRSPSCILYLGYRGVYDLHPSVVLYEVVWPPAKVLVVVPDTVRVYAAPPVTLAAKAGVVKFVHIGELLSSMDPDEVLERYNVVLLPYDAFNLPGAVPNPWRGLTHLLDWLARASPRHRLVFVMREAATLLYTRGRLTEEQSRLKARLAKLMREARHYGANVLADTQRIRGVEASVREIVDTIVLKRVNPSSDVGEELLAQLTEVLYGDRDPRLQAYLRSLLSRLEPREYIALHGMCAVYGQFRRPPNHIGAGGGASIPVAFATPDSSSKFDDLASRGGAEKLLDDIPPQLDY